MVRGLVWKRESSPAYKEAVILACPYAKVDITKPVNALKPGFFCRRCDNGGLLSNAEEDQLAFARECLSSWNSKPCK